MLARKAPYLWLLKKANEGVPKFLWYECEDSEGTNGKPIEGSGTWTSEETGIRSAYIPDSTKVGTRWYYCEIYLTYQGIVGEKVTSACAEYTVKALEWPLKGEGSEKNPYIIVTADDLEAIRSSVAMVILLQVFISSLQTMLRFQRGGHPLDARKMEATKLMQAII